MGKPTGFKEFERKTEPYRDALDRLVDFKEIYTEHQEEHLSSTGCPLHGLRCPFLSVK